MDLLPFLKVCLVFAGVVYAIRKRAPLGLALLGGGVAIALLQAVPPLQVLSQTARIAAAPETSEFAGVIALVVALNMVLQKAGAVEKLAEAFQGFFRSARVSLAALPAMLGLLPMPGGALFSAPMVEAGARGLGLKPDHQAAVNYWFRHVWTHAWPLFPSLILAAHTFDIRLGWVALAQSPVSVAALAGGAWFLLRGISGGPLPANGSRAAAFGRILALSLPLLAIVATHLAAGWPILLCVAIGLLFAIAWHAAAGTLRVGAFARDLFTSKAYLGMLVLGFGAKIFGGLMEGSGAIEGVRGLMVALHLPVVALAIALPFVVGVLSGLEMVVVATTFPLLINLDPVAARPLPYLVLAFSSGWCGMMLSPMHSCLALSAGYFRSDMISTIRRILVPAAATLAVAVGLLAGYLRIPAE